MPGEGLTKRTSSQIEIKDTDWVLPDFSGYTTGDELYNGPFCVLSIVDNRRLKRLIYQVSGHEPEDKDITAFLCRLETALERHKAALGRGTTDVSPVSPDLFRAVFDDLPHQACQCQIFQKITKANFCAVAKVRKKLTTRRPAVKQGQLSTPAIKRAVRQRGRLQQKITDLFEHRHLSVEHDSTTADRGTSQHVTRGLAQLRMLRAAIEEVCRFPNRRCRTDTVMAKLHQQVSFQRSGKGLEQASVFQPGKALTLLDDTSFLSNYDAVEQGNCRHSKMQKAVYGFDLKNVLATE